MGKVVGGRIGKDYKKTAEKGGGTFVKTVPVDDSILVRFIDEPEEWFGYYEHYDAVRKYYPCTEGDCPGCADTDNRRSFRYLVNVVMVDEKRVVPLKVTKDLANQLFARYEKHSTLKDREYELSRTGSGMKDTVYMASPEPTSKFAYSNYPSLDLEKILEEMLGRADAADPEVEDEKPKKSLKPKAKPVVVEDDDDEVADDTSVTRDDLEEMSLKELRTVAREAGIEPKGLDTDALIDAILGESDPTEDDDEEDEDEDSTSAVEDVDADDEEADEDSDSDDEEEDVEELTEDDLKAMSDTELRALCKEMGVKVGPRSTAKSMIASLLDE